MNLNSSAVREFNHARSSDVEGNRKSAIFPLNLFSHNHIYISMYLFSIRDDSYKNMGDKSALAREIFYSGCRPCLKNARA